VQGPTSRATLVGMLLEPYIPRRKNEKSKELNNELERQGPTRYTPVLQSH